MKIGQFNTVRVHSHSPYGLVLQTRSGSELVLPVAEIPPGICSGDELDVFIYTDGNADPVATLKKPLVTPGNTALLKVVSSSEAGYWLDWGLAQDLLLPRSEQSRQGPSGDKNPGEVFVYVLLDEHNGKISATTRLHRYFSEDGRRFKVGEKVSITIAGKTRLGYKAIINQQVLGLLFADQTATEPASGEQLTAYVKQVRADGKVDLTLYAGAGSAADLEARIIKFLEDSGGSSDLTDNSSPQKIHATFQVSKKHYKRALGRLYKARRIVIEKNRITLST